MNKNCYSDFSFPRDIKYIIIIIMRVLCGFLQYLKYIYVVNINTKKIDVLRCGAKSFFRNKFISVLPCITLKLNPFLVDTGS